MLLFELSFPIRATLRTSPRGEAKDLQGPTAGGIGAQGILCETLVGCIQNDARTALANPLSNVNCRL